MPPANESAEVVNDRKIRKQLEEFHGKPDRTAVGFAWPYLKDNDRFIRYAARIAIEHQPVNQWQEKALNEKDPVILTQAMIALARNGNKAFNNRMFKELTSVNFEEMSVPQQVDLLRAFEVTLSRMGLPDGAEKSEIISYLDPKYPASTNELNQLLSKILVFLGDPEVINKTLALISVAKDDDSTQKTATQSSDLILRNPQYGLDIANMLANAPPAQQIYLTTVLSGAKDNWTPAERDKYFELFPPFLRSKGGNSFTGYINSARIMALANLPKAQFAYYDSLSGSALLNGSGKYLGEDVAGAKGPGRDWAVADALSVVQNNLIHRNFEHGRAMFKVSLCSSCHSIKGEGGSIGPDLTQLGTRFSDKDILESIIEPDKTISDQYAATIFQLKNGTSIVGRLTRDDDEKYYVSQNPFAPLTLREILKKDVTSTKISDVSIMLPGLINRLNPDELKDLMAYLKAGGNKDNEVYKAKSK